MMFTLLPVLAVVVTGLGIHLYFEESVGLGNQLLSLASVLYLKRAFFPESCIFLDSTLANLLNFTFATLRPDVCCHLDASHEMAERDMQVLFNISLLNECTCVKVKGGQYFVPHLRVNLNSIDLSFKDLIKPLLPSFNNPLRAEEEYQAVHLRYFSNEHEPYPDHLLARVIDPNKPLYISSLFRDTAKFLLNKFPNMRIYQPFSSKKQKFVNHAHDREVQYQINLKALIDIFMLSQASALYLTPESTFSYVAAALSMPHTRVYFLSRHRLLPKPLVNTTHNRCFLLLIIVSPVHTAYAIYQIIDSTYTNVVPTAAAYDSNHPLIKHLLTNN